MTTPISPTTPLGPALRAGIARRLVEAAVHSLPVLVRYPDGREVGGGRPGDPVLEVLDADRLWAELAKHPKIGLGETYMAGYWREAEGTDLARAFEPFAASLGRILPRPLLALRRVVDRALPAHTRNTLSGARNNISAHYDLSNDFFAEWLDDTMTYSAALFSDSAPWSSQSLVAAQHRKIDAVLDAAGVGSGTRLLEIGTGWGELAVRAARRGAEVTSITLSLEQQRLARQRADEAGVRVDVLLQDYRETAGTYDAVVSVEMIEAVGEEYWPAYFTAIDRLLAPNGVAVIQAILMDHDRFLTTRNSFGWVQKHIFPGGLIPSLEAIEEVTERQTSLRVTRVSSFGLHYAETLRRWRERFEEQAKAIDALGFDETFRRMWRYYLAYSEAGFSSGYLQVSHITLTRNQTR